MFNSKLSGHKKRILLLEDEEVLGQFYVKAIDASGYEPLWLKSTEGLVRLAEDFLADLILLDNTIRGEDCSGVDLIPELNRVLPNAPIIVLSNYDKFQLEEEGVNMKKIFFLLKIDTPPSVLAKRIQEALSN